MYFMQNKILIYLKWNKNLNFFGLKKLKIIFFIYVKKKKKLIYVKYFEFRKLFRVYLVNQ